MKKLERNKGFTLIELIIVVAIIAILVGVITPNLLQYIERANQVIDTNNARAIADALYYYSLDVTNEPLRCNEGLRDQNKGLRGYVYVDDDEVRCSDELVWKALVDTGLLEGEPTSRWNTEQVSKGGRLRVHAKAWSTYQVDFYFSSDGIIEGFSYSAIARAGRTELGNDEEISRYFASKISGATHASEIGQSQ
ncbi:MAG: prepilin-type N-terminal cleavage/methylation domain-containing protein [Lachnospiraceae bacterium]|nr:prepilin-type N-terminal cleavage/methylation domain-containing protein [Lachnospiraceae bacterium]